MRYTVQEHNYIVTWYGKIRIKAIAAHIGRSPGSVAGYIRRNNIIRHRPRNEMLVKYDREELADFLEKGWAAWRIAKELNCHENYIRQMIKEELGEELHQRMLVNGITDKRKPYTVEVKMWGDETTGPYHTVNIANLDKETIYTSPVVKGDNYKETTEKYMKKEGLEDEPLRYKV